MAKTQVAKKVDKVKKTIVKENPIGKKVKSKRKYPARVRKSKEFFKRIRRSRRAAKKEPRGVVYLSHIPHGFYDKQIEDYFQQFGKVTDVSVPKSKSGNARGYAFVEFLHPEVAEIAAETMNNYLMFNRVIKAKYLPPAEQKPQHLRNAKRAKELHCTLPENYQRAVIHNRKLHNRRLKVSLEARLATRLLRKSKKLKSTLSSLGLDYDFQVKKGNINGVFKKKKELDLKRKKEKELSQEDESLSSKDESVSSEDESVSSEDESVSAEDKMESPTLEDNDVSFFEDLSPMSEDTKNETAKKLHKANKSLKKKSYSKFPSSLSKLRSVTKNINPKSKFIEVKNSKTKKPKTEKSGKGPKPSQSTKIPQKVIPSIKQNKKGTKLKTLPMTSSTKKHQKSLKGGIPLRTEVLNLTQNKTPSKETKVTSVKQKSNSKVKQIKSMDAKTTPSPIKKTKSRKLSLKVNGSDGKINFITPPNVIKEFINRNKESNEKPGKNKRKLSLNIARKISPSPSTSASTKKPRNGGFKRMSVA